jgi:hypothetical protein
MLSDEEKQVVDYLIFHKYENSSKKEDMIDKVIEIIEKQSKEIEELKKYEEGYKLLSYGLDNYTSNDKIKAKIAELIKEGNYRTADNPNGRVHFQKEITDYQIEVLQSLLEKE